MLQKICRTIFIDDIFFLLQYKETNYLKKQSQPPPPPRYQIVRSLINIKAGESDKPYCWRLYKRCVITNCQYSFIYIQSMTNCISIAVACDVTCLNQAPAVTCRFI